MAYIVLANCNLARLEEMEYMTWTSVIGVEENQCSLLSMSQDNSFPFEKEKNLKSLSNWHK